MQAIMVAVANSAGPAAGNDALVAAMTGMAGVFAALLEQSMGTALRPGPAQVEIKDKGETKGPVKGEAVEKEDGEKDSANDLDLVQCLVGAVAIAPGPQITVNPQKPAGELTGSAAAEAMSDPKAGAVTAATEAMTVANTAEAGVSGAKPDPAGNKADDHKADNKKNEATTTVKPSDLKPSEASSKDTGVEAEPIPPTLALNESAKNEVQKKVVGEPAIANPAKDRGGKSDEALSVALQTQQATPHTNEAAPAMVEKISDVKSATVAAASPTPRRTNGDKTDGMAAPTSRPAASEGLVKNAITPVHPTMEEGAPTMNRDGLRESEVQEPARAEVVEGRAVSQMALNTERLVEHLAGPDLKFTVRLSDSGQVQVVTNMHERTVQLGMVTDRAETVSALRSEVPYLEEHLRSRELELGEVKVAFQGTIAMDAGYSGEQRSRQEWRNPVIPFTSDAQSSARERQEEPLTHLGGKGSGKLSLLA
jgi:hypothetical protein